MQIAKTLFLSAAAAGLLNLNLAAADADGPADKSQYHLFDPTPRELMRDMSTDRPDRTESPYTVDAGHFQIESDLGLFLHDHFEVQGADARVEAWSVGTLNLKAGICNFSDLQILLAPYSRVKVRDWNASGAVSKADGFGDIVARLKVNIWGNDSGSSAGAIMPYVSIPTASEGIGSDALEGGVILPVSFDIGNGFGLGLMTQADWVRDFEGSDYHQEFVNTIVVGHGLTEKLGTYLEFASWVSAESGSLPWMGTVNLGFSYAFTPDIQLDTGINIGVTKSAPDWNPFIGLAVRF